jgi:hypothetical protein
MAARFVIPPDAKARLAMLFGRGPRNGRRKSILPCSGNTRNQQNEPAGFGDERIATNATKQLRFHDRPPRHMIPQPSLFASVQVRHFHRQTGRGGTIMEEYQGVKQTSFPDTSEAPEAPLRPEYQVRITSGALRGFEGTVIAHRNGSRMLIAAPEFGSGVFVQIDPCLVEWI